MLLVRTACVSGRVYELYADQAYWLDVMSSFHFILCVLVLSSVVTADPPAYAGGSDRSHPQQPARKINPEALKKYVGRYSLDAGIIPISTLDVSLENNELWVKPSVVKKRRLIHKSKTVFVDEIEGTPTIFNKDEDGKIVSVTFKYEGASYTAPRVVLPPPSLKGNTTFQIEGIHGREHRRAGGLVQQLEPIAVYFRP